MSAQPQNLQTWEEKAETIRRRKTLAMTIQQIDLGIREIHTREAELSGNNHQTSKNCRPLSWLSLILGI